MTTFASFPLPRPIYIGRRPGDPCNLLDRLRKRREREYRDEEARLAESEGEE